MEHTMAYGVVARFDCINGKGAAVLGILREMREIVAAEDETQAYAITVSVDDPDVIWIYEMFDDRTGYDIHAAASMHENALARIRPLVTGVDTNYVTLDWEKSRT
jgi:quinol monooxygenase YgiN